MKEKAYLPLRSPTEVPIGMTDSEARAFWDTHEITEEYLAAANAVAPDELPPTRMAGSSISLRLSPDTLRRLKALAHKRGQSYLALLKEFVNERLAEEEKREGAPEQAPRR